MKLKFANSAAAIVCRTLAALFTPPPSLTPSQWGAANLIVPDGPRSGEKWDVSLTPYIVEPLDNTGPDSPVTEQSIVKSAQTGFTVMAIVSFGYHADADPSGGMLLVQPTEKARDDFLRDKLNPAIEQTPALKAKIAPQISRSGDGSTAYNKRYPGGSTAFAISNSTADLRSKTKKRIIRDEASEYPADLDGQGSPHEMIAARRTSFLASGDWKDTAISTPTILGACYITERFLAGDQRRWHVRCPHCADGEFVFRFGKHFVFNDTFPHAAHYVTPCCGSVIEAHEKFAIMRGGRWIATAPAPGRPPSYHFDALSSPFVPWDEIAKQWIAAQTDPAKLKAFYNLVLGEAYEIKGDAPDHVRLMERREDYRKGLIPPRGLMLTGFADVQMRGIYYEIVAWQPDRGSWVIDADVLPGDTTNANDGAFLKLAEVYAREYTDSFGGRRRVDAFGVDSGFRTSTVYDFCRTRHNAYATKGVDGWSKPALASGALVDVDIEGTKLAEGVKLWLIGNWPLKGHFYEDLRREGKTAGHEIDPPGFCHFGKWLDEVYFLQITSEHLAEKRSKRSGGRITKAWEPRGARENHWLDCRIGNMALADHLGLSRMTEEEWKFLARERAAPLLEQGNLFAAAPFAATSAALALHSAPPARPEGETIPAMPHSNEASVAESNPPAEPARSTAEPTGDNWIGRDTAGWLDR